MGSLTENNTKYMFPIILMPYLQFIFIALQLPPEITMQIWIYTIIGMAFAMTLLPMREYIKHQRPADGKSFARGPVVYLNYTSRDRVFGFKGEYEEIKIDWSNEKLAVLEHSRVYLRGKQDVLKAESLADREGRQTLKSPEELKKLNNGLNIDMRSPPLEQLTQALGQIKHIEYKETIEEPDTLSKKQMKRIKKGEKISVISDETEKDKVVETWKKGLPKVVPQTLIKKGLLSKLSGDKGNEIKPEILSLETLGIPTEKQLEILRSTQCYYRELYHSETLEGYEYLEFSKMFLLMPDEMNKILATSEMELHDYDDYVINAQGCDVIWWCMGFVNGNIPIMYCFASENMVKLRDPAEMDAFLKRQTPAFYMRMKIMEHLIYTFLEEGEAFHQVIDNLNVANDGLRKRMDYMIQEYRSDSFIQASPDVRNENIMLREKIAKQSKWKFIGLVGIVISIILLIVIVFGLSSINFKIPPIP